MEKPEEVRVLYAGEVRESNTHVDGSQEVVDLGQHERIVDHQVEQRREMEREIRGLARLLGAQEGETILSAAVRCVEERDGYKKSAQSALDVLNPGIVVELPGKESAFRAVAMAVLQDYIDREHKEAEVKVLEALRDGLACSREVGA